MNSFFLFLYRTSPKIFISKCTWLFARVPLFYPFNLFIFHIYIWWYKVDIQDVEQPLSSFRNVNQFFIRKLKPETRPFPSDPQTLGSPVEGFVSCFGPINQEHQLLQAKGKSYSLTDLLDNPFKASQYQQGFYLTIYLSPKDYHRIHTPVESQISFFQYIPGTLFPVNSLAVHSIENLFPRNERLVTYLSTTE
ncbi:MAG: archaetidylserine decarboxylase, partial [Planctomycetota bacterium]